MTDRDQIIEKLYQDYLREKLDLIFNNKTGASFTNNLASSFEYKIISKIDEKQSNNEQEEPIIVSTDFTSAERYGLSKFSDGILKFTDGITIIKKNGKYNFLNEAGEILSHSWFDISEIEKKYSILNKQGEPLTTEWFDYISELDFKIPKFKDGFTLIMKDGKYNFISEEGKILLKDEYDDVGDFHEGFAVVKYRNEKTDSSSQSYWRCNLINKNGELISTEWYDEIGYFYEGFVKVKKNNKFNFIDKTGKIISKEWYDETRDFHEGFVVVKKDGKSNYMDKNGNLISKEWFDSAISFNEGIGVVRKGEFYCFINEKGELLHKSVHKIVYQFSEGFAVVKLRDGGFNFINKKGKVLSSVKFDEAHNFNKGFAPVSQYNKWNFINKDGELISELWFDNVYNFEDGISIVQNKNKRNIINKNGKLLLDVWVDSFIFFKNGYARISNSGKYNVIDRQGNYLYKNWLDSEIFEKSNKCFVSFESGTNNTGLSKFKGNSKKIICRNIDMGNYKVKKTPLGYQCTSEIDSYKIKYQPIKRFGLRYTLCMNEGIIYLYDRIQNKYIKQGDYSSIEYDNNFIINLQTKKIFFIYDDKLLDITNYYFEHLINQKEIKIEKGLSDIYSLEEFYMLNISELETIIERERVKNKNIKEELFRKKEQEEKKKRLNEASEREKQIEEEKQLKVIEALKQIQDALKVLDESDINIEKMKFDDIFISVDDHLEIKPFYIDLLRYIDLSAETFEGVKTIDIDFRGCNIRSVFNPQKVYKKSLKGCNFESVFISPFMDFSGVDIRGCKFSVDDNSETIDMFNGTFAYAIYDETTTYNGIPFTQIINKEVKDNISL